MAICVSVDSDGYVKQTGFSDCLDYVLVSSSDYQAAFNSQINALDITTAFTWGFAAVVVTGWFAGYSIGIAKRVIRLA